MRFSRIDVLEVCLFSVVLMFAPVLEGQGHSRKSKTISGALSPGSLTAGSSVKLSGSASAATVVDSNGNYSFIVTGNGSYTVTPSKTGISFQPASQTVAVNGSSNAVVNFTATSMLQSIAISAAATSITKGSGDQFTAIGTSSDGTTQNLTSSVTWASSNTGVATVSATGLATGIGAGSASISASKGGIASNAIALAVAGPTLQSINVTAPNASLAAGSGEQLTATGNFSDGSSQNLTSSALWSSSNSAAISLGPTAMATAAGVGQSVISATQGGITSTLALSATAKISGMVTPAASAAGTTVALSGPASATTIADVNGNYSFTVSANGAYTVTPSKASYGFSPSNAPVTVSNANVAGVNFTVTTGQLAMTPTSFSFGNVNLGATSQIHATLTASGGDVIITGDTITGSGFGLNGITFPTTIATGTSASFNVTFTPASTGNASGTISLANNTTTLSTANLSGSGAGLSVTPSNVSFGQVLDGTSSSPQALILNAVGSNVTITSDNISQNGGGGSAFSIGGLPALPFTLNAGQSVQGSVKFAPSLGSPGTAAGTVTFVSNMNSAASTMSGTGASNVGLAWAASTTPSVTYNVYRCSVSATACSPSQPANFSQIAKGIAGLSYTDSSVSSGQTYYYALTAVDTSNAESVLSAVSTAAAIP